MSLKNEHDIDIAEQVRMSHGKCFSSSNILVYFAARQRRFRRKCFKDILSYIEEQIKSVLVPCVANSLVIRQRLSQNEQVGYG